MSDDKLFEELEECGFYNYKYKFQNIAKYRDAIALIKESQKVLIKEGKHFINEAEGLEGSPIMKNLAKLALLAFNSNAELVIEKVRFNNYQTCEDKIKKVFDNVNTMLAPFNCSLTPEYLQAKIKELSLALEYEEEIQRIKQEQDDLKAQIREEQKAIAEAERKRDAAIEEEEKIKAALEVARKEIEEKSEAERQEYQTQIEELQRKLEEAHQDTERAVSNAQITAVGHVYIISNIGSFGENVYKIGMTRRDEPMDRVRELGDASVPFSFDVHGFVFSENARKLEADLHNHFEKKRVNKVNKRKEFFSTTLDEIEKACKKLEVDVKFTKLAEAREYRESLGQG